MDTYRHHVSGFFVNRAYAEKIVLQLIEQGIPVDRIFIYDKDSTLPTHVSKNSDDVVLKDVLVDGAIGAAVGTGVGALVEVALIATNVTLFVASPLIAPLILLGWGASVGGLIGATAGAAENIKPLSDLVHDAILNGQFVVVVEAHSKEETAVAGKIFEAAIGDSTDVL